MDLTTIALIIIVVSAVFQGFALKTLANKQLEEALRKKKYTQLKLIGYALLLPAVGIMIYAYFFKG